MRALNILAAAGIRIYHFLLCTLIIFGSLFSTSLWECLFILMLLVIVHVSQKTYKRCIFTEIEKIDGIPSMSEVMKTVVSGHDMNIPRESFELILTNIFIFIICFRMSCMVVIPSKILFA